MTITRNFKLYLNAGTASAPYINVNQYDEGEEWVFTLYNEDGSTYTPSSGAIIGIKSDGNAIMNAGSVVGGKVVITETEQMTAASGRAIFELLIDNATHGTANFIVNVERRPSDDAEFSDSDLSMLQEAIDAAEVINEILDEGGDPSEIIAENVDAWLDNHPEATTTVLDGAITAPKINNSLWDKLLVSEEASGNPASFEDGADDVPVSSLKVALEPVQLGSGDPSPTNIRPISGHSSVTVQRTGKNLLNSAFCANRTNKGITTVLNADGSITLTGTAEGSIRYWSATDTLALTLPIGTYTLSPSNLRIEKVVGGYSNGTFTLAEPTTYQNVYFTLTRGTTYNTTVYPQLEVGSEATAYEPYTGTSYPYSLGQNVYGGTVDLATGVLTVTHVIVDMGSLTWSRTTSYAHPVFYVQINEKGTKYEGAMSSAFKNISSSSIGAEGTFANASNDGDFACSANNAQIFVRCDQYTTPADFKTAVTGYTLVYPLATPTTINLTPTQVNTLLGYNNISSSGTVDVIYHADTKLYIDKKIGELS